MQIDGAEPVASTSRLSDAASSLVAAANAHARARAAAAFPDPHPHPVTSSTLSPPQPPPRAVSSEGHSEEEENGSAAGAKGKKRRTRNGCLVCRKRKKLCDEQKPACGACSRLSLACEWEDRVQAALERRQRRIERMKLKEKQQQQQRDGADLQGVSTTTEAGPLGRTKAIAKRKTGKLAAVVPPAGGAPRWDTQEAAQAELAAYNPAAPAIYPPPPLSTSPSIPYPPALPPPLPALDEPSPLHSPDAWMPFLGSFAPAGYEPAAAPDPLAWSLTWPVGMGYSPFVTGAGVGPSLPGQFPVIGNAPPPAARGGESDSPRDQMERDQLDLDALAQLDHVQSDMLLQGQGGPQLVRSSQGVQAAAIAAVESPPGNGSSPPFDLFALLRSPSPVYPFGPHANGAGVPLTFDGWVSAPAAVVSPIKALMAADTAEAIPDPTEASQALAASDNTDRAHERRLHVPGAKSLPATVGHAASFLASSDWAFTQAYLLSHYTSSLARLVSIASSPPAAASETSSSGGSDPPRSRRGRQHEQTRFSASRPSSSHSRPRDTATARSTRASANLFLSLVPLANRHPYLLHAILSWSAANLAAASTSSGAAAGSNATASAAGAGGGNSIMATLSDQLGHLADEEISAALPELEAYAARRANTGAAGREDPPSNWEVLLAARLMLTQAAICQGAVDLWRVRLGEAAHVINLVGGVQMCRTPLARQLVKNLLYHDVLSSTSRRDGLLLDYSFLRHGGGGGGGAANGPGKGTTHGGSAAGGTSPATTTGATPASETDEERRRREAEEDEEDVLDTLMGCAESVFLLVGRITSLAKEKRESLLTRTGGVPEDKLDGFMHQFEELRIELEREKERMDAFLIERPDLEPHRYFHEVFRLAALVYLNMLLELPPTSYPILLLVRKMLSLTEVIVSEGLPGLCSMHWPLFLMHLNSTPLISPHAPTSTTLGPAPPSPSMNTATPLSDRARSTLLFDAHMHEFTFMNTKRSRLLIDEAWRRSEGGHKFVDPDRILDEWEWDLNWA
ncbi:hypothetical protein JCM3774_005471 [Rhodotorula dairenensis]